MPPFRLTRVVLFFVSFIALSVAQICSPVFILAQTFDETFETWPVDLRIRGSVIVSGGGAFTQETAKVFLETAGDDSARIVVLVFNSIDAQPNFEEFFNDVKSSDVISIDDADQELSAASIKSIENATGIWLLADKSLSANQNRLLSKHASLFRDVSSRGGSILAGSGVAGSVGQTLKSGFADLEITTEEMNLVPDTVIYSGYDESRDRNELLSVLAANPRRVGIGIEPDTNIILRGRQIRVMGSGSASFYLAANEIKPLRVQHVKQSPTRRANPYEFVVDLTAWRRDAIDRTLPQFPATDPEKPFVKNGSLIIIGGGGIPKGVMERMVDLAGGEKARMIYVPCTEQDVVAEDNQMLEMWKTMGVESATVFHTKDRNRANSDEDFLKPLEDATGIWFGGGRQWNFSDSYYGTKAHRLMKKVVERGGVIGGSSAGASIQGRYLARANPLANFDIMADGYERGLGFISGVAIDQHFTQRGRQKDMTQLVNRYPQLLGIGIDETTALIVTQSQAEVVGKGDVYFYDRQVPVVPGEPDYTKVGPGSVFDLAERKVIDTAASDARSTETTAAETSPRKKQPSPPQEPVENFQKAIPKTDREKIQESNSNNDWQHWRGPEADGSTTSATPPLEWNEETNIAWKTQINGEGSSTPVVVGDKVFLTSAVSTKREMEAMPRKDSGSRTDPPRNYYQFTVWCLSLKTGEVLWQDIATEAVPLEGKHESHTYAAGSPITDGEHVYFSFGSQGIYCYDLDGKKKWDRDLGDMRTRRGWGEAVSPALFSDRLIVTWDHEDESKLFVLDSASGEIVWDKVRDEPTTWATPLVTEFENQVQVITNGTNSVTSYDLKTGEVIWETAGTTLNAIPCPVRFQDSVICMAGYQGNRAISIKLNSRGKVAVDDLNWNLTRNTPYVPSPSLSDDRLYFTKGNSAIISCANAATGEMFFDATRIEGLANLYASPVIAGGHVFVVSREGVTAVLKDDTEFKLLGTNTIAEPIDASPVIVGDTILLRSNKHLYCIRKSQ